MGFSTLWKKGSDSDPGTTFTSANQTPGSSASQPPASSEPTRPNVKVNSPIILEEYGDYQCQPCGLLYPELKQIEHEYKDQVRFVFHHFPLPSLHKNAMAAAHAAEAARNQSKFLEMHDLLYTNQKAWSELPNPRETFLSYARQLKLNVDQFTADMDGDAVDQRIKADQQRGAALGVTGTPTVFIDSQRLRYEATNLEGLRRGLNVMLERKAAS